MHTSIEPFEVESVDVVNAVSVEENASATIATTLYDLIATIQAVVAPDEDVLVVATVAHLLRSRRVTWLGNVEEPEKPRQDCLDTCATCRRCRRSPQLAREMVSENAGHIGACTWIERQ